MSTVKNPTHPVVSRKAVEQMGFDFGHAHGAPRVNVVFTPKERGGVLAAQKSWNQPVYLDNTGRVWTEITVKRGQKRTVILGKLQK